MRRVLTFALSVAAAVWLAAGCQETNTTFQGNTGGVITFLSPANASAGGPDFTLTVRGQPFTDKTVVQWDGSNRTTTFVDATTVTALIKAADIASPGQGRVNTFTPQSGSGQNGLSNTVIFVINPAPNPVPAITSISPDHTAAGGAGFPLTITGTNFLAGSGGSGGSEVHWNPVGGGSQTNLTPSAISATQITVTITANLIAAPGSANVSVSNPPAPNGGGGGGPSNAKTFTIDGPVAALGPSADSPALSADGRYVAFVSDSGGHAQVFVRDTCEGAAKDCEAKTTLISANAEGDAAAGESRAPSISADGRFVAFDSDAKDLAEVLPAGRQVFVRDTCAGAAAGCKASTMLVSTDASGALTGNDNVSPAISASGRFVAFVSVTPSRDKRGASSTSGQKNSGFRQVFVRDTCLGATECVPKTLRISLHPGDGSNESAPLKPAMSGSGKKLALPGPVANIFTRSVAIDDRVFLALTDTGSR